MPSQLDLDQGGTSRAWNKVFLGHSIGWIWVPNVSVLPIIAGGTYTLDPSTNYVPVNTTGSVVVILPSAAAPRAGAGAQPNLGAQSPVTIVDVGGNAGASHIVIQPNNLAETIMGLLTISISVNYGGYTLAPNSSLLTWNSISP